MSLEATLILHAGATAAAEFGDERAAVVLSTVLGAMRDESIRTVLDEREQRGFGNAHRVRFEQVVVDYRQRTGDQR